MTFFEKINIFIRKNTLFIQKTYLQLYLVNLVLNFCLFYNANCPAIIKKGIGFFLMVGGLLLALKNLWELISLRGNLDICFLLLLILLSFMALSGLFNYRYGINETIKICVWSFILFFLVFPYSSKTEQKTRTKILCEIILPALILWGIMEIVSIIQFLFQISYFVDYPEYPIPKAQGVYENRLFGIFVDAPMAATISWSFLLYSILIRFNCCLRLEKISNAGIFLNWIYIVLSNTRTGKLIAIVGMTVFIFFCYVQLQKKKRLIFSCIVALFCSCVIIMGGTTVTQSLISHAVKFTSNTSNVIEKLIVKNENISKDDFQNSIFKNPEISFERIDLEGKPDISNFRFQIWADSLKAYFDHPIWGVSIDGFSPYMAIAYPDSIILKGFDVGNGYLSVLVYAGPIACVSMIAFIILELKRLIPFFLDNLVYNNRHDTLPLWALIGSIATVAAINMDIFYINWANAMLFWLSLGALNASCMEERKIGEKSKKVLFPEGYNI